jgi:hypothetical protein
VTQDKNPMPACTARVRCSRFKNEGRPSETTVGKCVTSNAVRNLTKRTSSDFDLSRPVLQTKAWTPEFGLYASSHSTAPC